MIALPMSAVLLIKFAVLAAMAVAAGRISAEAAAAHGVLYSWVGFMFIAAVALGQALIPEVARAAADDDFGYTRAAIQSGLALACGYLTISGAILFIWAGSIAEVLSADPDVRHLVVSIVPIMLMVAVIDACQAMFGFGLAGLKRSAVSLRNVAACYGVLALAVFPAGSVAGLAGMWTAFAVTTLLLLCAQSAAFYVHSRNHRQLPTRFGVVAADDHEG